VSFNFTLTSHAHISTARRRQEVGDDSELQYIPRTLKLLGMALDEQCEVVCVEGVASKPGETLREDAGSLLRE
jgi:hypothetical protein